MNIKVKNLTGGIAIVTINEPKTYNSLSFQNLNSLIKVFRRLDKDKNISGDNNFKSFKFILLPPLLQDL